MVWRFSTLFAFSMEEKSFFSIIIEFHILQEIHGEPRLRSQELSFPREHIYRTIAKKRSYIRLLHNNGCTGYGNNCSAGTVHENKSWRSIEEKSRTTSKRLCVMNHWFQDCSRTWNKNVANATRPRNWRKRCIFMLVSIPDEAFLVQKRRSVFQSVR